jgi:Kef-type K+ transport system membrane component KefB
MSPWIIGLIAFAGVFGGALLGMFLARVLPEAHLSSDAKDVIRVAMAMVATLAVLVLALLISSARNTADEKDRELRATGAQFILLDRTMAQYGAETKNARDLLKALVWSRLTQARGGGWQPGQVSREVAAADAPQMEMAAIKLLRTASRCISTGIISCRT